MMKNNILELITSYRKTVLFLAIYRLGFFDIVKSEPIETEEISSELNVNRHAFWVRN